MTKETKVKPIRTTEEVIKRFDTLTENFPNQSAALEALINAYELQSAKNGIPDRATEIAEYDTHLQAIQRCYLHALDVAQDAESRIRDEFRHKLETLDEEKEELRRKLETAKNDVAYYKAQAENATEAIAKAAAATDNATKHAATLETALTDKQTLIEQLKKQVEQLTGRAERAEDKAKKADSVIKDLNANIRAGVNRIQNLEKELQAAQTAATIAAAKATAAQAEAIANAERIAQRELADIQRTTAETMKGLYEQINQLTERAATAEARANAAALMNDQETQNAAKPPRRKAKNKAAVEPMEPIVEGEPPEN